MMLPKPLFKAMENHTPERQLSPVVVWSSFLGVIILWAASPFVMAQLYPDITHRGLAGDLFGAINALFSGLAFAGVIIAILLQREELALQRREITLNRQELARAATAQEDSRQALRETIHASAYKTALDILQEGSVRNARGFVIKELDSKSFESWSVSDITTAEIVCATYDTVGIMTKYGVLPVEWVADNWGHSLRTTWRILKPLVDRYRRERSAPEFWDDFERLATEAHKFQRPAIAEAPNS